MYTYALVHKREDSVSVHVFFKDVHIHSPARPNACLFGAAATAAPTTTAPTSRVPTTYAPTTHVPTTAAPTVAGASVGHTKASWAPLGC